MKSGPVKIELLAPARNLEAAKAAVDYGADALYMGGPKFGARQAAGNTVDDIAGAVGYARRYGVRVYAALNTLLFDGELEEAERVAQEVIDAGVDALIIQDMAYLEMGLKGMEFHASTQTFNASPEKVKFLQEAGFARVILERGLTFDQIKAIRSATHVDLECFVHGAVCVCNSGRCWMSRAAGWRSGNRGECGQPCRMPYDLRDEAGRTVIKGKHLLSVQDLDLSGRLGQLLDSGITSFKIEGRLKELNYVKNTVNFYRRRLDEEIAQRRGFVRSSFGETVADFEPDPDKTFTRGRSEYFFGGKQKGVASLDTPKAVGSVIGMVTRTGAGWIETDGQVMLSAGDGICFMSGGELVGTSINKAEGRRIYPNKEYAVGKGVEIYRNYDHAFSKSLERSRTRRFIDISAEVEIGDGHMELTVTDVQGISATVRHEVSSKPSHDTAKTLETLRTQITKSGDSIFRIADIKISRASVLPFVPVSAVNSLRRKALDLLLEKRLMLKPGRKITAETSGYLYYDEELDGSENVTNSLSGKFYMDRGVKKIEKGFDLLHDLTGARVMRTPYCIRREIGQCLKGKPSLQGNLNLIRGRDVYRLEFDCAECMMNIVYAGRNV